MSLAFYSDVPGTHSGPGAGPHWLRSLDLHTLNVKMSSLPLSREAAPAEMLNVGLAPGGHMVPPVTFHLCRSRPRKESVGTNPQQGIWMPPWFIRNEAETRERTKCWGALPQVHTLQGLCNIYIVHAVVGGGEPSVGGNHHRLQTAVYNVGHLLRPKMSFLRYILPHPLGS